MREDDLRELRLEVERIYDRIDNISNIQVLQVRADGRIKDLALKYFTGKGARTKARIYLAADGNRTMTEIAEEADVDPGQVTRKCKEMQTIGLLRWEGEKNSKIYYKTVIEDAFYLSKDLQSIAHDS